MFHTSSTVELDGGEWPISCCDHFLPVERARGPQFPSPPFFFEVRNHIDIVGTVYHLVMYMQSNKIHKVILMSEFIQHLC